MGDPPVNLFRSATGPALPTSLSPSKKLTSHTQTDRQRELYKHIKQEPKIQRTMANFNINPYFSGGIYSSTPDVVKTMFLLCGKKI